MGLRRLKQRRAGKAIDPERHAIGKQKGQAKLPDLSKMFCPRHLPQPGGAEELYTA